MMKAIANIAVVVAVISLVIGIISKLVLKPIALFGGLDASAFLTFTNTCFLLAIVLILLERKQ